MHKEKFFLIIIKHNQLNIYFGVDVSLHVLLQSVVERERERDRDRWWALVNTVMNIQGP